jgi:alpha-glucuronidase
VRMTFSNDPGFVQPVVDMMMGSREAVVDYMMPLGLHHLFDTGHHYGPGPWVNNLNRADWNPTYYHQADANGVGFARGPQGSNATSQYSPDLARIFADPRKVPEQFLLWFHHLPWNHQVSSGRTLWHEMVLRYTRGVDQVRKMRDTWATLKPHVDEARFTQVAAFLEIQLEEAQWWRDACIAYFQSVNQLPLPAGVAPPKHPLEYYKSLKFPYAPGRG